MGALFFASYLKNWTDFYFLMSCFDVLWGENWLFCEN